MDLLLIIGLVVWIANAAKKRKEAEKRHDAAKKRANTVFEGMFEGSSEGTPEYARESIFPAAESNPQQDIPAKRLESQLTTPQQRRHTLEPSRKTGHAHAETSMSGVSDVCPPDKAPFEKAPLGDRLAAYKAQKRQTAQTAVLSAAPQAIDLAAASPEMAFRFDPNRVREGLIYAEILGKPKALRR